MILAHEYLSPNLFTYREIPIKVVIENPMKNSISKEIIENLMKKSKSKKRRITCEFLAYAHRGTKQLFAQIST